MVLQGWCEWSIHCLLHRVSLEPVGNTSCIEEPSEQTHVCTAQCILRDSFGHPQGFESTLQSGGEYVDHHNEVYPTHHASGRKWWSLGFPSWFSHRFQGLTAGQQHTYHSEQQEIAQGYFAVRLVGAFQILPAAPSEHGIVSIFGIEKVNEVFSPSLHDPLSCLRIAIHVKHVPTTPCTTLGWQPGMHGKLNGEPLIESRSTLKRGEVSLTETVACGSGSCFLGIFGKFTISTAVYFDEVRSYWFTTRFFGV